MESVKCVIVGDGEVGKTCLLMTYSTDNFPGEYIPTVFDNFSKNLMINDKVISLGLWDTAGQAEYSKLRAISYDQADLFIICFSTVNPHSFDNVRDVWYSEVRRYSPNTPKILVGTKTDLREDINVLKELKKINSRPIYRSTGLKLARAIGAIRYFECSSFNRHGLKEIFEEATKLVLIRRKLWPKKKNCCQIL
ncbi:Ras-related protein Rac1 [Trichoplax sp. H2]|uniref:Uncharacterized protein n=1 Tax=Trichoplax adhaerens TaxID=10228 RepID=B3RJC3_TRIAD|nr:hypothetical protein TRIADDRAFT_19073 [Trichoplax adhaerens]EDV29305.1 hypothetical protein TRIADDRAFT_19073 [Trichoplax adhaerens]RDD42832.1 Ras-related protein Rac1 [Trichoplax sp. H2]|eukprot:XP_002108507.1 hypothetical protein TRIADDRAFT_19073 [Trichoplax adhaerens]